jgi:hypothetical protein
MKYLLLLTLGLSLNVFAADNFDVTTTGDGKAIVGQMLISSSTQTSIAGSASSFSLLSALTDHSRGKYKVYNSTNKNCYIHEGSGAATATNGFLVMAASGYYEETGATWQGAVTAICDAAVSGNLFVTEEK